MADEKEEASGAHVRGIGRPTQFFREQVQFFSTNPVKLFARFFRLTEDRLWRRLRRALFVYINQSAVWTL